ncbi:MAG: DsrE/DsrF/TusD sulfur relay family protein [Candidatus Hydrothermarchaeales archaeon]
MGKIGILLTTGPFQFENWKTAADIGDAALDLGHEVKYFLYLDGVYNPMKTQKFPEWDVLPVERYIKLKEKGAEIIACGICINARGLENGKDYFDGAKVGGMPDFSEIIGEVDSLITL